MFIKGDTIVNLSCSILNHFGAEGTGNPTMAVVDKLLEDNYKNVVVVLMDAMGKEILESNLSEEGFLRSHIVDTYSTVYPPTTVAAVTSYDSGLYPNQHGWLGWVCYYKQLDKNVTVFRNTDENGEIAADFDTARTFYPYCSIDEKIKKEGIDTYEVSFCGDIKPDTPQELFEGIGTLCKKEGRKYIYAYINKPDETMHKTGTHSEETKAVLRDIENSFEKLCGELEDTIIIVTADHGQVNPKCISITDYPKITECLKRNPSIEARTLNLFIKDGMKEQFISEFNKEFGDKYRLYDKDQVIKEGIFGPGNNVKNFEDLLGDYVAIAVSDLAIFNSEEYRDKFIGVHAGFTKEELEIPLIVYRTK